MHSLSSIQQFLADNPPINENVTAVSRDLADATMTDDLDSEDLMAVADILNMITNLNSSSPQVRINS